MAKTDWKAEAKALKKKVRKLKDSLTAAATPVAEAVQGAVAEVVETAKKALKPVSPLAPAAFPRFRRSREPNLPPWGPGSSIRTARM